MNIKNFGKTEYYETEAALVNDLKNKYFLKIGKHPGLRAITEPIFAEGLERAVLNDKRNLVFAEESLAEVNPFLDEYEKMPKFESFGKRL